MKALVLFLATCSVSVALAQEARIADLERKLNTEADITALDELYELGKLAVPAFIRALQNKDPDIRGRAAMYAAQFDEALSAVVPLTKDKVKGVRLDALHNLGERRKVELIGTFLENMGDSDLDVRHHAAVAAFNVGSKAVSYLLKALDDKNEFRRETAIQALGHLLPNDSRKSIIQKLHDNSGRVREAAATYVGGYSPEALRLLINTLGDYWARTTPGAEAIRVHSWERDAGSESVDPGLWAVFTLICWPKEKVVTALLNRLQFDDKYVRYDCISALKQFPEQRVVAALERVRLETDGEVRNYLEEAIGLVKEKLKK